MTNEDYKHEKSTVNLSVYIILHKYMGDIEAIGDVFASEIEAIKECERLDKEDINDRYEYRYIEKELF